MNIMDVSQEEKELISLLRKEAEETKDCFTKFSFQAIALSGVVLGVLAGYQPENPFVGLASTFVIILILTVSRIGIYKYGAANRYYGYELHLFRTRYIPDSDSDGWRKHMRSIGWEEAMRAWRVVQATCYDKLHTEELLPPLLGKGKVEDVFRPLVNAPSYIQSRIFGTRQREEYWGEVRYTEYARNMDYHWFQIESLAASGAIIHTGTYLRTMLGILNLIAALSLIPLYIVFIQFVYRAWEFESVFYFVLSILAFLFSLYMTGVVYSRATRNVSRREIMETGFLSIHSCSIMWQAVIVAHYRALNSLPSNGSNGVNDQASGFAHYTELLSVQAVDLSERLEDIHEWVK